MALERRSATIMANAAALDADPGPRVAKYAITIDNGRLYRWVPDSTTTADDLTVIAHTGGYAGRWILVRYNDRGTNLVDGAQDIAVAGGFRYVLPASTLTGNSSKELQSDGAAAGDVVRITRLDVGAFTMPIVDEASAATIFTFPASQSWFADFRFDGTNWSAEAWGKAP